MKHNIWLVSKAVVDHEENVSTICSHLRCRLVKEQLSQWTQCHITIVLILINYCTVKCRSSYTQLWEASGYKPIINTPMHTEQASICNVYMKHFSRSL